MNSRADLEELYRKCPVSEVVELLVHRHGASQMLDEVARVLRDDVADLQVGCPRFCAESTELAGKLDALKKSAESLGYHDSAVLGDMVSILYGRNSLCQQESEEYAKGASELADNLNGLSRTYRYLGFHKMTDVLGQIVERLRTQAIELKDEAPSYAKQACELADRLHDLQKLAGRITFE